MDLGIANKLALVTGASKGLGQAIAIFLAQEGARLILVSRSEGLLLTLAGTLSQNGRSHHVYVADLSGELSATEAGRVIQSQFGNPDIIVHNLGGSLHVKHALAPLGDWHSVWHFNLGIAIQLNSIFVPPMSERKWGRIVHISSAAAQTYTGYPAY